MDEVRLGAGMESVLESQLVRIADALERIATALEHPHGEPEQGHPLTTELD